MRNKLTAEIDGHIYEVSGEIPSDKLTDTDVQWFISNITYNLPKEARESLTVRYNGRILHGKETIS